MENVKVTNAYIANLTVKCIDTLVQYATETDGADAEEVREKILKIAANANKPKPKTHGDSITFKQNVNLFEKYVRPYLAEHEMATARQIAENVDGLPVNANGRTTTQKVHGILSAALTTNRVELVDADSATAFKKSHKISDKACKVYRLC